MQRTGGTTLTVSLPKTWAASVGLRAGDGVRLVPELDGSLRLLPSAAPAPPPGGTLRLSIAGEGKGHLERRLIGAYLAGYQVLELRAPRISPEQREAVRALTRKLIGPEIIEETLDRVTVQDLLNPAEFRIEKGLRRVFLITRAMHHDALIALKEGNADLARDVEQRDDEVDRLTWLITRQYTTLLRMPGAESDVGPVDGLALMLVARILERIGDHAVRVAQGARELRGAKLSPAVLKELEEASGIAMRVVEDAVGALLERDTERAERAILQARRLQELRRDILGRIIRLRGKEAVSLAYVLESIERAGSYGTDISEVAINRAAAGGAKAPPA